MHYPLSTIHVMVYESIDPRVLFDQTEIAERETLSWTQYEQEVKSLRLLMIQQFVKAKSGDALRTLVHICQAGYISLIERLSYYVQLTPELTTGVNSTQLILHYQELQRLLISQLAFLNKHYTEFLNLQEQVPAIIAIQALQDGYNNLRSMKNQLLRTDSSPELTGLVFSFFKSLTSTKTIILTYRELFYFEALLQMIKRNVDGAPDLPMFASFEKILIQKNFNLPAFIDHVINEWRKRAELCATIEEQIFYWTSHIKDLSLLSNTADGLFPEYTSVKDRLILLCEQESSYLSAKTPPSPFISKPATAEKIRKTPVVTSLSTSQLGVFIRILTDAKIIQYDNQAELLRMVASCLTTTKMNSISAEGLRVRYYNPEKAAVNITREYITEMLSHLKNYR